MKPSLSAAVWAWLIFVFVTSFLTWGKFGVALPPGELFGGFAELLLRGASTPASAWTSSFTLLKTELPNWLPIVAAFGAVAAVYARKRGAELSPKLPRFLLIYAIAQVALFCVSVLLGDRNSLGAGALISLFALIGLRREIIKIDVDAGKVAPPNVPVI